MNKSARMTSRELALTAALVVISGLVLSATANLFVDSPFKEALSGFLACITFATMGYLGGIRAERYRRP